MDIGLYFMLTTDKTDELLVLNIIKIMKRHFQQYPRAIDS
jgi:hypothetical protein